MKTNRVAVLTGSTSEIGQALSRLLLKQGFSLVNIDRNHEHAKALRNKLLGEFPAAKIENFTADLAELRQIEEVAQKIADCNYQIASLFHNAGVLLPNKQLNNAEVEMHFSVNAVAPYYLTKALIPCLQNTENCAVIVSGSAASGMARNLKLDQLLDPKKFNAMSGAYAQSKAAVKILFSSLQAQYLSSGISFLVVDLPPTKTKMATSEGMPSILRWLSFLFATPEKLARKLLDAAVRKKPSIPHKVDISGQNLLVELVESLKK